MAAFNVVLRNSDDAVASLAPSMACGLRHRQDISATSRICRHSEVKQPDHRPRQSFDLQFTPGGVRHGIDQHPSSERISQKAEFFKGGKASSLVRQHSRRPRHIGLIGPSMGAIERAGIHHPAFAAMGGYIAVEPIAGLLAFDEIVGAEGERLRRHFFDWCPQDFPKGGCPGKQAFARCSPSVARSSETVSR